MHWAASGRLLKLADAATCGRQERECHILSAHGAPRRCAALSGFCTSRAGPSLDPVLGGGGGGPPRRKKTYKGRQTIMASTPIAPADDLLAFAGGRKYASILADPPWRFTNRTGKMAPEHRRLSRYATLTTEDIVALPVSRIAAEMAHLYLWVPNALLPEGLRVLAAWELPIQVKHRLAQNQKRWRLRWSRRRLLFPQRDGGWCCLECEARMPARSRLAAARSITLRRESASTPASPTSYTTSSRPAAPTLASKSSHAASGTRLDGVGQSGRQRLRADMADILAQFGDRTAGCVIQSSSSSSAGGCALTAATVSAVGGPSPT